MKILVADKFEESGIKGLQALGCEVDYQPSVSGKALAQRLQEHQHDILIVRSTKVDRTMIESPKLALIIRAGAGYNTIDIAGANERGVLVSNCPGKNALAVAELAFGLLIACDRRIPENVAALRAGQWKKGEFSKGAGLFGRTLGLIGMGRISQEMIQRAKGFGMRVVAFSRWMTPETAAALQIGRATSLEELAQTSDFVSVHLSLTPETKNMLGEPFFNALKPGAIFINTSRGEVVDQPAMIKACRERGIKLGLDVFIGEPEGSSNTYDGELASLEGAYCTHHIGAGTDQAQEAVADETVRIVREYILTGSAPNVVNVAKAAVASHLLVVRHADRVGVLAHVLQVLKDEQINVQEMENVILGGAKAAIAQIAIDKALSAKGVAAVKSDPSVFDVNVVAVQRP